MKRSAEEGPYDDESQLEGEEEQLYFLQYLFLAVCRGAVLLSLPIGIQGRDPSKLDSNTETASRVLDSNLPPIYTT